MKKLQLCLTGLLLSLVLIGCSSDDENEAESEENDSVTEEENNENTDNEPSDSDANNTENEQVSTSNNEEVLSLGETGKIESVFGDYEVTVNSFKTQEDFNGEESMSDFFLIVDYTVKNVGSDPINGEDVYWAELVDDEETMEGNQFFDSAEQITGEIPGGETANGELVFYATESSNYQLIFNYGALEENATTLTWEFNSDEASN